MQPATTIPLHDAVDIRTSAKAKNGPCRCIVMRVSCVSRIDRSMCQCNVRCPAAHLLLQALWTASIARKPKKKLNVTSDCSAAVTVNPKGQSGRVQAVRRWWKEGRRPHVDRVRLTCTVMP